MTPDSLPAAFLGLVHIRMEQDLSQQRVCLVTEAAVFHRTILEPYNFWDTSDICYLGALHCKPFLCVVL